MAPVVRPRADDVWLSVASASFDPVLVELFLPLVHGNSVVMAADSDVLDGDALRTILTASKTTVLQATPLTWRLLLQAERAEQPDGDDLPLATVSEREVVFEA